MTVVQTALGSTEAGHLGPVLPHEHLFINLMPERRGDGLLNDEALMATELSAFRAQGGGAIVELTPMELTSGTSSGANDETAATNPRRATRPAHNVVAIQRVSRTTGVQVVLGTGHYRDPYLGSDIDALTPGALAEEMVRDLEEGFPGTDARAGVIGEIGADKWFISAREERVFRAAARAHRRTGAAIYTHAARWQVGLAQLALLREEGVDITRVAVGHADTVPDPGYVLELARAGAYVGLDTINSKQPEVIRTLLAAVERLVRAGFLSRILLSHDVCLTSHLTAFGGNGFGFVLGDLRRRLLDELLEPHEFEEIVKLNPLRLLTGDDGGIR